MTVYDHTVNSDPQPRLVRPIRLKNRLGIDSLDFLDIAFAIDKNFGIKIPLEKWTEELNENKADVDEYFILSKLCGRIDELIAAKDA